MKKRNKILIVIFALQLVLPMVMCIKGIDNEIHFKERAKEIKVKLALVECDMSGEYDEVCDRVRIFIKDNTYDTEHYIEGGYFSFEEDKDGFYNMIHTRREPDTQLFIADKEGGWGLSAYHKIKTDKFRFITDYLGKYWWLSDIELYSDEPFEYEEYSGFVTITEPPAEAYAVLNIYNGKYEIKEIYIDGLTIEQYIENLANGTPDRQKDLESFKKRLELMQKEWE